LGAKNEGQRPEEMFKFRVSEMPFPGLWEGRRIHFTIYWGSCRKVWIIWFFAVCHGLKLINCHHLKVYYLNDKGRMILKKRMVISKLLGGPQPPSPKPTSPKPTSLLEK
jgi:hypothetical protein